MNFKEYNIISMFHYLVKKSSAYPVPWQRVQLGSQEWEVIPRVTPGSRAAGGSPSSISRWVCGEELWSWGLKWVLVHRWGEAQGMLGRTRPGKPVRKPCVPYFKKEQTKNPTKTQQNKTPKPPKSSDFFFSGLWISLVYLDRYNPYFNSDAESLNNGSVSKAS